MRTLAIETSCDDTSLAIVKYSDDGTFVVEYMRSFTQLDIHGQYGGVVPELASRSHAEKILHLLQDISLDELRESVDIISVTTHPGLPGALLVGKTAAYTLGEWWGKPVIEVNHIMGHVFSILCDRSLDIIHYPYICLTVSGGHNDIYLVESVKHASKYIGLAAKKPVQVSGKHPAKHQLSDDIHQKHMHLAVGDTTIVGPYRITKLGQTMDDACGEAFDKVARMLDGPYPGGARLGELAKKGTKNTEFNRIRASHADLPEYCFSFSGIKSQVAGIAFKPGIPVIPEEGSPEYGQEPVRPDDIKVALSDQQKADIAWKVQEEVCGSLSSTLLKCAQEYDAQTVAVCGGVSASLRLRECIADKFKSGKESPTVHLPKEFAYCTDNAAMIGVVGLLMYM